MIDGSDATLPSGYTLLTDWQQYLHSNESNLTLHVNHPSSALLNIKFWNVHTPGMVQSFQTVRRRCIFFWYYFNSQLTLQTLDRATIKNSSRWSAVLTLRLLIYCLYCVNPHMQGFISLPQFYQFPTFLSSVKHIYPSGHCSKCNGLGL